MLDAPRDHVLAAHARQVARDAGDQPLLIGLGHHPVERARLDEIVVLWMLVIGDGCPSGRALIASSPLRQPYILRGDGVFTAG